MHPLLVIMVNFSRNSAKKNSMTKAKLFLSYFFVFGLPFISQIIFIYDLYFYIEILVAKMTQDADQQVT